MVAGVSAIGAPEIERTFTASHATIALVLFVVPGAAGLALEPILFLLADRHPRRHFVRGGLAALAVAAIAAALAPGPALLAAALAVGYVASGAASSLAQATVVDRAPDARGRTLARWTLLGVAGDLAAPAMMAALAALGATWRAGFAAVAAVLIGWTALVWARPFPEPARAAEADDPPAPLWAALRAALADRRLVWWLFATALCDLLDELFVVFASIHVRDDLGASAWWQSATVAAFVAGGALGLATLDRVLRRHGELAVLVAASVACAVSYAAWLAAPSAWACALAIVPVGATASVLYPLASAQAYAARPGASGAVLAASHLFTPLSLALPWLVGAVADRAGTHVALALLAAQPIGIAVISACAASGRATPGPRRATSSSSGA
ncbi:MAG TPA: MFS transporter [Kofleriaceae bacterium]|nr:MFS transporter [Kofleriaceae bacterium]